MALPSGASPLQHGLRDGSRQWLSRSLVALLVTSLAAVALVAILARQAIRAGDAQRRMAEQSVHDYATFGASAFANRSAPLIVGSADYLLGVMSLALERGEKPAAAIRQVMLVADSGLTCNCGPALLVRETRILDAATGATVVSRINAAFRDYGALPFDPVRLLPAAGPDIRWRMYGSERDGVLIAVRRLAGRPGRAPTIGVVMFHGPSIARELLAMIYRSRPNLLPNALLGAPANDSLIAIEVRSADDQTFARFGPAVDSLHRARLRYAVFNPTSVIADLAPTAVGRLRESARSAPRVIMVVLLAAMTMIATCLALWFSWRNYRLGRLRMDFASSISHELRTPLTEIMLYAELIESGRTQRMHSTEQAARTIRGEARRLHQLVENSLHVARTERRLIRLSPAPESLATIIDELLDTYAPIASRHNVAIRHLGDHTAFASVDPDAIRHILLNVLDNALRYGPVGEQVTVSTQRQGSMVTITVDDEGPGIPVTDRKRIFEPYVRLGRDVDSDRTGSGIGLAVVADLVREMQGQVRVESAPGGGTRVVLEFPVADCIAGERVNERVNERANGRAKTDRFESRDADTPATLLPQRP